MSSYSGYCILCSACPTGALAQVGVLVYDVFGSFTIYNASGSVISVSSVANSYMFTAREYDPETGLYYYRARYYSSTLGRFLQADPIGYKGGLNLYTYCGNNPVMFIDEMGLCKTALQSGLRKSGNYLSNMGQSISNEAKYTYDVTKDGIASNLRGTQEYARNIKDSVVNTKPDPGFGERFKEDYDEYRLPGDTNPVCGSLIRSIPYGPLASVGIDQTMKYAERTAAQQIWKNATFTGSGDFLYMSGKNVFMQSASKTVSNANATILGATVFYTAYDVGSAIRATATAWNE